MVKIETKKRRTYYTDWDFFQLWIISNSKFYIEGASGYLKLSQIEGYDYENIRETLKKISLFFEAIEVKKNHIRKYSNVTIQHIETEKQIKADYPADKEILASFRRIRKWSFTIDDVIDTYGYLSSYDRVIYFPFDYPQDELEKIYAYLNKYIDEFINHELIVSTTSVLVFEKQKEWLVKTFKDMQAIEKFGNNFIVTKKGYSDKEVLFFHTLYALEKLEYIEVINIWFTSGVDSNKTYHANILVNEIFIKEINQDFKKENPEKVIEKFDSKTGILSFGGKKIELSKKGKETDAVLLMNTLLKEEEWEWVHNDEILEDWWYSLEEQGKTPKNKVYFALQKINKTMELEAQIENFIEWGTTKARINPKYRQIDK